MYCAACVFYVSICRAFAPTLRFSHGFELYLVLSFFIGARARATIRARTFNDEQILYSAITFDICIKSFMPLHRSRIASLSLSLSLQHLLLFRMLYVRLINIKTHYIANNKTSGNISNNHHHHRFQNRLLYSTNNVIYAGYRVFALFFLRSPSLLPCFYFALVLCVCALVVI